MVHLFVSDLWVGRLVGGRNAKTSLLTLNVVQQQIAWPNLHGKWGLV